MRVAIALHKEKESVYPGPFGHAPRFAIYEVTAREVKRIEIRPNPYAALEGGDKPEKMRALLGDVDLRVGARFGHHGHPHGGFHRLEVGPVSLEEALALVQNTLMG
ncbi:MAG: NifB/NifX family molybdenum-iron cluster-binding protein [Thermaceae bacterium]